jgi:hypothetical protein
MRRRAVRARRRGFATKSTKGRCRFCRARLGKDNREYRAWRAGCTRNEHGRLDLGLGRLPSEPDTARARARAARRDPPLRVDRFGGALDGRSDRHPSAQAPRSRSVDPFGDHVGYASSRVACRLARAWSSRTLELFHEPDGCPIRSSCKSLPPPMSRRRLGSCRLRRSTIESYPRSTPNSRDVRASSPAASLASAISDCCFRAMSSARSSLG